jgi:uncharacterized protein (DUF302 family)
MTGGIGIVSLASRYSFEQTLRRLEELLVKKDVRVFAKIDHSGEAEKVGIKMPPTCLLIFGSPKLGTPVMLTAPTSAIDLPLKALVWEDKNGKVWVSYNDPRSFADRFSLSGDQIAPISVVGGLAKEVTQ